MDSPTTQLMDLPPEILNIVLDKCDLLTTIAFCSTCKSMLLLCREHVRSVSIPLVVGETERNNLMRALKFSFRAVDKMLGSAVCSNRQQFAGLLHKITASNQNSGSLRELRLSRPMMNLSAELWGQPSLKLLKHLHISQCPRLNLSHLRNILPSLETFTLTSIELSPTTHGLSICDTQPLKCLRALCFVNCNISSDFEGSQILCQPATDACLPNLVALFFGGSDPSLQFVNDIVSNAPALSFVDLTFVNARTTTLILEALPRHIRVASFFSRDLTVELDYISPLVPPSCISAAMAARDQTGRTVLHYACESGNAANVRRLRELGGVDPNPRNSYKNTPLMLAAGSGKDAAVREMTLFRDVELEPMNAELETPLFIASLRGHEICVQNLLDALAATGFSCGTGRSIRNAHNGWTPLMAGCLIGNRGVVSRLLKFGFDVHYKNRYHQTALHMACRSGVMEVVQHLLDRGADPWVGDEKGLSPYDVAVSKNHTPIAEHLCTVRPRPAQSPRHAHSNNAAHPTSTRSAQPRLQQFRRSNNNKNNWRQE